jgi:ribosome production factor 2
VFFLQIESGKKTLFLHGTKTSAVLNAVLTQIYHLKKESAVKYSRKNDKINPFEAGGETSLEFFSQKTDCSLFLVIFVTVILYLFIDIFYYVPFCFH